MAEAGPGRNWVFWGRRKGECNVQRLGNGGNKLQGVDSFPLLFLLLLNLLLFLLLLLLMLLYIISVNDKWYYIYYINKST